LTRDDGLVGPHIDFQGRLDPTDSYGYLGILTLFQLAENVNFSEWLQKATFKKRVKSYGPVAQTF
jgi:hypothetical protein